MRGSSSTLISLDSEIKRTTRAIWKARRETKCVKEEIEEMGNPLRPTIGDYCKRTFVG